MRAAMKKIKLLLVFFLSYILVYSQKPNLDISAIDKWPEILNQSISPDGGWVMYSIGRNSRADSLMLSSTDGKKRTTLAPATSALFNGDSRYLIYLKQGKLSLYDLRNGKWVFTQDSVLSFKIPAGGDGKWLAFMKAGGILVVYDLFTSKQRTLDNSSDYYFSGDGNALAIKQKFKDGKISLRLWELIRGGDVLLAGDCKDIKAPVFDKKGEQLAFLADEMRRGIQATTLRYYAPGMDSAVVRVDSTTDGMDHYALANGIVKFAPNGESLFFQARPVADPKKEITSSTAGLNFWDYQDEYLPTEKLASANFLKSRTYTRCINKGEKKVVTIDREKDQRYITLAGEGSGGMALTEGLANYFATDGGQSPTAGRRYLINLRTGERKELFTNRNIDPILSPSGDWVMWYNPEKHSYFVYETKTGKTTDITASLDVSFQTTQPLIALFASLPYGLAGWLEKDGSVLIYDEYDIWKINLSGSKAPVNITNGYGRKHNLCLRIFNGENRYGESSELSSGELLLAALNKENYDNGFFKVSLQGELKDPVFLSIDSCLYYAHEGFSIEFLKSQPIRKAKNAEVYLLEKMNSNSFPNLYATKDFKNFTQLSYLYPEKAYNWLTTELMSFKQRDGSTLQGILYKPENFDATKKYPVIFYFYEKLSGRLHGYLEPELSVGSINIPYYVSNGYLVFTPDINYTEGLPGDGALNAVVSAAKKLSQLPYVDSERMGLQGHSFGGYEVNYIVSHSKLFAAAQDASGASDFISYYNGSYREHSAQFYFEWGQGRIGSTLWQRPDLFIYNSPIFNADKVETPLLIMHNKDDGEVPFQQGLEWFTALRRLGKKVWMLQYDGEYHTINRQNNKLDFTVRTKEFFDYYLKGSPQPQWMKK